MSRPFFHKIRHHSSPSSSPPSKFSRKSTLLLPSIQWPAYWNAVCSSPCHQYGNVDVKTSVSNDDSGNSRAGGESTNKDLGPRSPNRPHLPMNMRQPAPVQIHF